MKRVCLPEGYLLTISGKKYTIVSALGEGASSVCYRATKADKYSYSYVIKEFYPIDIAIRNSQMQIVALDDSSQQDFIEAQKRWNNAIRQQYEIQRDTNHFMELEDTTDRRYAVMRYRDGMTLTDWVQKNYPHDESDKNQNEYVWNCIGILMDLAACVEHYQKAGLIHFDVKPDNVYLLKDNNGKYIVRLIDYDSVMSKGEFLEIARSEKKISMYSTKEYYGEEVWSSLNAWKKYANEETWQQVDVYALGTIFGYMLLGYTPRMEGFGNDFSWFCDNDPVIPKTSVRREVLIGFINKTRRIFGSRYHNASNWKFVLENIQALFFNDNYLMFDGFQQYRKELVPELIVGEKHYSNTRSKAPIEQVFDEYVRKGEQNICLVAESGMGKSTALRKLFLTKILEDQSDCRFYYYPLRKCVSLSDARDIWEVAERFYRYPKSNNYLGFGDMKKYFLFDAFDELNEDDEDLQDSLKLALKRISKNTAVVLTSQFKITDLGKYNIITFGEIVYEKSLGWMTRIKNNSSWLEKVGINIFQNPLIITMSENFEKIKFYITHDKDIGIKGWNRIKRELLGKIEEESLGVNYAGELIWNYTYVALLQKYINTTLFEKVVSLLKNINFLFVCEEYPRETKYNIDKRNKLLMSVAHDDSILMPLKEIEKIIRMLDDIVPLHSKLWKIFVGARRLVNGDYSVCDHFFQFKELNGNEKYHSLFVSNRKFACGIISCALEISGAKYNKIYVCDSICYGNIEYEYIKKYSDEIFLNERKYIFKSDEAIVAEYQKNNRFFIYDWLHREKQENVDTIFYRETKLICSNVATALFFTQDHIEFLDFKRYYLSNIYYYNHVENCNFSCSLIRIRHGVFSQCVFQKLIGSSFLDINIYSANEVDRQYEKTDKYGNCITSDGENIVSLYDYTKISKTEKKKLRRLFPYALKSCINKELIFEENFTRIDFSSPNDILSNTNYKLDNIDKVVVKGNADLVGIEFINNIEVHNSNQYYDCDGILYYNQMQGRNSSYNDPIVHINKILKEEVTVYSIQSDLSTQDCYGCKKLILDKHIDMRFISNILTHNFVDLEDIVNLPKGVCIILGMVIDFRDETSCPTILNILSGKYISANIIYIPEDFGLYLGWAYYRIVLKNRKKIFRPCLYHRNDSVEPWREEYNLAIQRSSDNIPWDHSYDNFWHKKFDWIPTVLINDDAEGDKYSDLIVEVYDELTDEERKEVMEQRNKWMEYIKNLPLGKKCN